MPGRRIRRFSGTFEAAGSRRRTLVFGSAAMKLSHFLFFLFLFSLFYLFTMRCTRRAAPADLMG